MSSGVIDNTQACINEMRRSVLRALEIIGGMAETYAKGLTPVDTGALRNSITHVVDEDKKQVIVGTNVYYAPYVELGTGKLYEPPPEWIQHQAQRGRGLDRWFYKKNGEWHVGFPQKPKKMIQRAITEHLDVYKTVIETELQT